MISSLVQAGMRAITPRSKKEARGAANGLPTPGDESSSSSSPQSNPAISNNKNHDDDDDDNDDPTKHNRNRNRNHNPFPTTPKGSSQATLTTPSTASTVDITANNTTFNTTMDGYADVDADASNDLCRSLISDTRNDNNNNNNNNNKSRSKNNHSKTKKEEPGSTSESSSHALAKDSKRKDPKDSAASARAPSSSGIPLSATATATTTATTTTTTTTTTATATAPSSKDATPATTSPSELWQVLDRQLRSNIGTSVRCGICLSTVRDPVRTQCCHGYCRDCITGYLRSSLAGGGGVGKCPECNAPCTRRSLESFDHLDDLAGAYKGMLRAFGLAPGTYRPEITTMTQTANLGYNDSDHDNDDNDDNHHHNDSDKARFDRLCVAATYRKEALPGARCSSLQVEENEQVVVANYEACFEDDGVDPETMQEILESAKKKQKKKQQQQQQQQHASSLPIQVHCLHHLPDLPNTQDVQEQAREQLEADREMHENSMDGEDDEDESSEKAPVSEPHPKHCGDPGVDASASASPNANARERDAERDGIPPDPHPHPHNAGSQLFATASQGDDYDYDHDGLHDHDQRQDETKQQQRETDPLDGPSPSPPPSPELPSFARADSGTKRHVRGRNRNRKSFSRYDRADANVYANTNRPVPTRTRSRTRSQTPPPPSSIDAAADHDHNHDPFEAGALSPIDHETSYWAGEESPPSGVAAAAASPEETAAGMVEDSRGGLHMLPLTLTLAKSPNSNSNSDSDRQTASAEQRETTNDGGTSPEGDKDTDTPPSKQGTNDPDRNDPSGADNDDDDDDCGSDKTIPMTAEDADTPGDGSHNEDRGGDEDDDDDDDEEEDDSNNTNDGPTTDSDYDPTKLTQVTEELHASTKTEIHEAASLPAGPKGKRTGRRQRPAKKILFDDTKELETETESGVHANTTMGGDPAQLTQVTDELHASTKSEIDKAANLPAGPRPRGRTEKQLFAKEDEPANTNDNRSGNSSEHDLDSKPPAKKPIRSKIEVHDTEGHESVESLPPQWSKGTIVRVQSRTWPGVNKQGGVGRIAAINSDGTYDVSYVLGGKESGIEAVFIRTEDQGDGDVGGASGEAKARRRRRAREDETEALPEELLRQLAEEGFDIPGQKGGSKKRKAKKPNTNTTAALSDSTNSNSVSRNHQRPDQKKKASGLGSGPETKRRSALRDTGTGPTDESQETKPKTRKRKSPSQEPPTVKLENDTLVKTEEAGSSALKTVKKSKKQVQFQGVDQKSSRWKKRISKVKFQEPSVSPMDVLLEISSEDAMKLANERYQQKIREAIENKSIMVACSNLKDEDKALLSSLCAKTLEGDVTIKTTEAINKNTTLCLVPAESSQPGVVVVDKANIRSSVRTLKVMRSALAGIPVVTPDWLRSCFVETRVVQPQRFVRSMPTKNVDIAATGDTNYGVAKLAAALQSQPKTPALPFRKMCVFLCGSYTVDSRKNMHSLLKAGGAKLLLKPTEVSSRLKSLVEAKNATASRSSDRLVILCGGSGVSLPKPLERDLRKAAIKKGNNSPTALTIVDFQWVVESVTCAKPMPAAFFEPKIHKNLWKLCV